MSLFIQCTKHIVIQLCGKIVQWHSSFRQKATHNLFCHDAILLFVGYIFFRALAKIYDMVLLNGSLVAAQLKHFFVISLGIFDGTGFQGLFQSVQSQHCFT